MKNALPILRYVLFNFGPLVVFTLCYRLFGLKVSIALSLAFTLGEFAYLRYSKRAISAFFIFSASTALIFGAIDLCFADAFLFKFEASISNIATGAFFVIGAFKEKPLIQEFAEKRRKFEITPELIYFFRLFTLIWAGYFFLKAAVYLYLAMQPLPLEEAMLLRTVAGAASFYALLAISTFGGRHLFFLFKKIGLLRGARARA